SGAVEATIEVVNTAPKGNDDKYSVAQNDALVRSVRGGVLANDSDEEGDQLRAELVSGPANGTLFFSDTGAFSYIPNTGFTGEDSFSYQASDGVSESNPVVARVIVSADAVELPLPQLEAKDDVFSLRHDSVLNVGPTSGGLLANDMAGNNVVS
ncbi:MAG: cadherin-like domain-containing protein, partial [Planctomycetes bacterium]|nr:cadherin-like domain-containing protein [Planctomycetota bacterium]